VVNVLSLQSYEEARIQNVTIPLARAASADDVAMCSKGLMVKMLAKEHFGRKMEFLQEQRE
jgi:hypothetical protein